MDPLPFPGSINSSGPEPEPAPENGQQFPKTRTSAKEAVSSRWASRAAEKSTNAKQPQVGRVRQKQKQPQQNLIQPTQLPGPPINRICQTWKQVQRVIGSNLLRHLALEQKHYKPKSKSVASASVSVASIKKKTKAPQSMCEFELQRHRQANKDQLANTLTNIRVSTALQNQLAEITNGQSKHYLKSVVSILPAGFDESSALTSTIQNRKRAFLLMDLGNVIRAHAEFITYTCGFGDMLATAGGGGLRLPPTHELLRKRGNVNVNNVGRKRKGVYIQPQFKVMKNPSSELLKLLTRLGVDLRCNSSDDVLAASKAIGEERTERMRGYMTPLDKDNLNANTSTNNNANANEQLHSQPQPDIKTMSLVDDVSKSRKPNGYFRRLLQAQSMHMPTSSTRHVHVAVDGVDEVHRISSTIEQLAKRNRSTMKIKMEGFRIILRLPVVETEGNVYSEKNMDNGTWERLVLAVHAAASEENCELAGVSVNLRPWSDSLSTKTGEESERILNNICTHLRIFRLLMLSVGQYHIRIDLTELPYPFNRENSEKLTASLKNMICSNVSEEELMQLRVHLPDEDPAETSVDDREVNNNDKSKQMKTAYEYIAQLANDPCTSSLVFTADVSDHLVARAGALCTRIIGVKIGKSLKQTNTNESDDNQDEDDRGVISKHYYIDDGCYGSLGSSTTCGSEIGSSNCEKVLATGTTTAKAVKGHVPIALYGGKFTPKPTHLTLQAPRKKLNCDALPTTNNSRLVNCTVWGPTCDGLDKVCNNIKLPEDLQANRDWLVFSNLGCGGFGGGLGLGTAFNGFDPPDVSYCVLGYFAHVK